MFTRSDCPLGRVWPLRSTRPGAALGQPPAHAPARARERVVGHGREALLVLAQREQQVGDAVRRRQVGVGHPHAPAVHAAAGRGRAARPPPPRATRRARRAPVTRPVRACRSRASWPTRSPSRPSAVALGRRRRARARGLTTFAPAVGVELGDRPGVGEQDHRRPGTSAGSSESRSTAGGERTARCGATVVAVHERACVSAAGAASIARPPVDRRGLGRGHAGAAAQPPAIGRRRITSSASSGSSLTCSPAPRPWLTTA